MPGRATALLSTIASAGPIASTSRLPPCTCWRRRATSHAFPKTANASPFEILNLPTTADQAEIKGRYYELAKLYHPDSASDQPEVAKERYRLVSDAYALLKDPLTRQAYLRSGRGWAAEKGGGSGRPSRRRSSSLHEWDPHVDYNSPFHAEYVHPSATRAQAYNPNADWRGRNEYSRSSADAARRARFYAAAQREAAQRGYANTGSEGSVNFSDATVRVATGVIAFAFVCVTLTVVSRSSSPSLSDAPSLQRFHPSLSPTTIPSSFYHDYPTTGDRTSSTSTDIVASAEAPSTSSATTSATLASPLSSSPASSPSGPSPSSPSNTHRASSLPDQITSYPATIEELRGPQTKDRLSQSDRQRLEAADLRRRQWERERELALALREAQESRRTLLRDERRSKSFGREARSFLSSALE